MAKFRKASADEAQAKRKEHVRDSDRGSVMVKGFKSPPSWNKDERSARFIMSSESVDRYRDIVVQAGLETDRFMQNPQGLLFHNSRSWPAGLWSDVTKILSGRPKRTEGKFNFLPEGTDEDADRAARHVAAGSIRTVSIGFIPDWDDVDFILDEDEDWTGGFRFNKSELIECSLVPVPAQPDALVKGCDGDLKLARDLIEDILDSYAKTPEGLLIPMDEYRAKYLDLDGNKTSVVVDVKHLAAEDEPGDEVVEEAPAPEAKTLADLLALAKDGADISVDHDVNEDEPANGFRRFKKVEGGAMVKVVGENGAIFSLSFPEWTEEDAAAVLARSEELKAAPSEKEPPITSMTIQLDTAEAVEKMNALSVLVDSVGAKFAKFFGKSAEKTEPEIQPEPPTMEAIEAAKAKAAETLARIANKGL